MNLETKITIYKFTPQVFTLTLIFFEFGLFPLLLSPTGDRIDTST